MENKTVFCSLPAAFYILALNNQDVVVDRMKIIKLYTYIIYLM